MKKVLSIICLTLIMCGCSLFQSNSTPTKAVESYLSEYQTLGSNVLSKIDSVADEEVLFDDDQKTTYKDILKKHYQDLTYEVKEETIDGDKATVEVEIEVNDYTKVLKEAETAKTTKEEDFKDENGVFSDKKYIEYKLDLLKNNEDRVKYTIYFNLTKTNDEWNIDDLSEDDEEKLLGIYEY